MELKINDRIEIEGYCAAWVGIVTSTHYQISKLKTPSSKLEVCWISKSEYHTK